MQQCTAYHLRIVSTCRPSGAEGGTIGAGHPSWGRVISLDGLGNPTPTDSTFPFSCLRALRLCVLALNFPYASRYHMPPLWGFGYLVYAVFYKHVAPLGLNASLSPSPFLPFLLLPPPRPLRLCVESYHVSRVTFHFP